MSAELLRRAVAALREAADKANVRCPAPWRALASNDVPLGAVKAADGWTALVGTYRDSGEFATTYAALVHPPVALAIAELLDGYAECPPFAGFQGAHGERLVSLARAVLREARP